MKFLALDIGGANLKLADGIGYAYSQHFALWQQPKELSRELRMLIAEAPTNDHLVITMTGELADCFTTRAQGVEFILNAIEAAADSRHTRVYLTDGRMVTTQVALRNPLAAAASNWHALASFAGRFAKEGPALLIDVGSTTTDVIPLLDGRPVAAGRDDTSRLIQGELVYTGVVRSPVCALARDVPYRDQTCPLAQELFATSLDVHLILEHLPDDPGSSQTADHRPATRAAAVHRLARAICADADSFDEQDARRAAQVLCAAQVKQVAAAIRQVQARQSQPAGRVIVSGQGEFLARKALAEAEVSAPVESLQETLGKHLSAVAPAHALAVLARESVGL